MITFPDIDPIALQIGPMAIHWYGLAYMCGILLAWLMAQRVVANSSLWSNSTSPITVQEMGDFVVWATIGIVLGGRLGYVLFYNLDYFSQHLDEIIALNMRGMSFHGGFLGVALAALLFCWRKKTPVLSLFDVLALVAPIGLFFGRVANFVNGELYGRITTQIWGVVFPEGGPFPRHPSQLYEASLEGLMIFFVLLYLVYRVGIFNRPGLATGLFVLLYGCSRIFVEFFREPDAHIGYLATYFTMGMILSLPFVFVGGLFIYLALLRQPLERQMD